MPRLLVLATTGDADTTDSRATEIERLHADLDAATSKVENLTIALETSRDIGTAMGILMATHKITRDQAFGLLRMASQSLHRKLSDIATEVNETGALPEPPKRKPPGPAS